MNPEHQEKRTLVKDLHKDFKITEDGFWYFNRTFNPFADEEASIKAKVFFEDPSLLDGCEFLAKIGENEDLSLNFPYIGFAYARKNQKQELKDWAKKFPHSELISGLDHEGIMTEKSKTEILKNKNESGN